MHTFKTALATLALAAALALGWPPGPAWADTLWVTTLEAVMGLDPATLAVKKTIPLPKHLAGGLYLLPAPGAKTAYLLSGGHEFVSKLDLAEGKLVSSWTLSESMGEGPDHPRIANARFFGIALDPAGKRILGNILTSRRIGTNDAQLEQLRLDRPLLVLLDAATGDRLATIEDVPWAISYLAPMEDPAHPNRFLVISPDLDVIDLDLLPAGKAPVRATFAKVRVRHIPLREPHMTGEGPVVILPEWFHPEVSKGLGSMPYYTTDPIVSKDQIGAITFDMKTGRLEQMELGPPQGQYAFASVVTPDRKRMFSVLNQLHEIDLAKGRLTRIKTLPYTYYACNMSPDGSKLYLFSGGARLTVLDPDTLEQVREVELPSEIWDLLTLPD